MNNYKELLIWQKAIEISVELYHITEKFLNRKRSGLTNQIRRSAVSIASNIAEGAVRFYPKKFYQFLSIANGSCNELSTQLIISNRVNFLGPELLENILNRLNEIQKMILSFQKKLKNLQTPHAKI